MPRDGRWEYDSTAEAVKFLEVNAAGTVPYDRTVFSFSGELVGWAGSGATPLDLDEFNEVEIGLVITASSGGALNTSLLWRPYDSLDGTVAIAPLGTVGAALVATGSAMSFFGARYSGTSWASNGTLLVGPPPRRVILTISNAGAATSVTGKVWVKGRK